MIGSTMLITASFCVALSVALFVLSARELKKMSETAPVPARATRGYHRAR